MEQSRLLIAIVLSFLIFLGWGFFFGDKEKPQQKIPEEIKQASEETPNTKPIVTNLEKTDVPAPTVTQKSDMDYSTSKGITINTPLYSAEISEQGAVFTSFILKKYKENIEDESPFKQLIAVEKGISVGITGFEADSIDGLKNALFVRDSEIDSSEIDSIDLISNPGTVSFSWTSSDGVTIRKIYTFSPDTYIIKLDIYVENRSELSINDSFFISLIDSEALSKRAYGFEGPSGFIDNKLKQIKTKKISDQNIFPGKIDWIALQSRYFMSAIIPEKPTNANMKLFLSDGLIESRHIENLSLIKSGTSRKFEYNFYFGPKSTTILNSFGHNLGQAINFGWFDFIAKPCVQLMNFLYKAIPNYGIAIIILTLITKILLWPLGTKSYKSMNKMKKLQPLMAEIRERYKGDKKKMNEEVMNLYRTYKVNPAGGCLPMILQIPVFFALYRMLYEAIELRHAPFLLWINDLSAPDRLFSFGFSIPFMEPPYGIPVLTIIMGASMFLQQKMSPAPGDPNQAKIMMLMPIIFTVIFINFSSGLVLYWLVNNLLSMGQQYYVSRKYD